MNQIYQDCCELWNKIESASVNPTYILTMGDGTAFYKTPNLTKQERLDEATKMFFGTVPSSNRNQMFVFKKNPNQFIVLDLYFMRHRRARSLHGWSKNITEYNYRNHSIYTSAIPSSIEDLVDTCKNTTYVNSTSNVDYKVASSIFTVHQRMFGDM